MNDLSKLPGTGFKESENLPEGSIELKDCVSSAKAYASNKIDFDSQDKEAKLIDQISALEQEREELWSYANTLEQKLEERRTSPEFLESIDLRGVQGDQKLELLAREAAREHEQANSYRVRLKQMETVIAWHEKQRLLAQLDRRKVSETSHELRMLREKVQFYADELERFKTENSKYSIDLRQSEEKLSQNTAIYKKELHFLEEELAEERISVRSLTDKIQRAEEKLNEQISESRQRDEANVAQIVALESELNRLQSELSDARSHAQVQQEALRAEADSWHKEHNCISLLLEEATRRLRDSQNEVAENEQIARDLTDRLNAEKLALSGAEDKVNLLQAERTRINEALLETKHELSTQSRRLQEAMEDARYKDKSMHETTQALKEAQESLRSTRIDLEESQLRLENLQRNFEMNQSELDQFRCQFDEASTQLNELNLKLREAAAYTTQLELRSHELEKVLQNTTEDRAGLRQELARVSNALVEVIDARTQAETELIKLRATLATQSEALASATENLERSKAQEVISVASIRELTASVDAGCRRISLLEGQLEAVSRSLKTTLEERTTLEASLNGAHTQIVELQASLRSYRNQLEDMTLARNRAIEDKNSLTQEVEILTIENQDLKDKNTALQDQLRNLNYELTRCNQEIVVGNRSIETLQTEIENIRQALKQKVEVLDQTEATLKKERSRLQDLSEILKKEQKTNLDLTQQREESLDQICSLFREVEETRAQVRTLENASVELTRSLTKSNEENVVLRKANEQLSEEGKDLRSRLDSAGVQNRQLSQDIRRRNEEISELRALNDSVSECLRNEQAAQSDRDDSYLREIKEAKSQLSEANANHGLALDRVKRLESELENRAREITHLNKSMDHLNSIFKEERDQNLAYVNEHNQALKEANLRSNELERKLMATTQALDFEKSAASRLQEDVEKERAQQALVTQGLQARIADEAARLEEAKQAILKTQQESLRLETALRESRNEIQSMRTERSNSSREFAMREQSLSQDLLKSKERIVSFEEKIKNISEELVDRDSKVRQLTEQSRVDFERGFNLEQDYKIKLRSMEQELKFAKRTQEMLQEESDKKVRNLRAELDGLRRTPAGDSNPELSN